MYTSWKNKQCLVVGLGISGRSAAGFLLHLGANVAAVDSRDLSEDLEIKHLRSLGLKVYLENECIKESIELVIVSPGIPKTHPIYSAFLRKEVEIIGEVELACRHLKQRFVGVTGTNGKTTVTLLTAHLLNAAGIPAVALGNSGVPLTSVLYGKEILSEDTIIIAELSSYQLETMHSKVINIGVILNITPDHLDRYPSMEVYSLAKMHIAALLKEQGVFYIEEKSFKNYGHLLPADLKVRCYGYHPSSSLCTDKEMVYFQDVVEYILPLELKGKRSHDLENSLIAYGICREFGMSPKQYLEGLATFRKPSHRMEFVCEKQGIRYINDSKGTNIDAVIRAIQAIQGPVILIAGGMDKGAAYVPWIEVFAKKVCCVCVIGEASEKISRDLSSDFPVHIFGSLEQAVWYAKSQAVPGCTILLSPGCSSLDMFKDYADRGNEFKRIVNSL